MSRKRTNINESKVILHLCADTGSDTLPYNYTPPEKVHGVIANPVCTEFSIPETQFQSNHC